MTTLIRHDGFLLQTVHELLSLRVRYTLYVNADQQQAKLDFHEPGSWASCSFNNLLDSLQISTIVTWIARWKGRVKRKIDKK